MISALGQRISVAFRRTAPDPFVIAVLLTVVTALVAIVVGFPAAPGSERAPVGDRATMLLRSWGIGGLWDLLSFSMQMCLILVTGHALAASRPVRSLLSMLAAMPRTTAQAAAVISLTACAAALVNWGLGLIVGALLAREMGRALAQRGVGVNYPLLAAAGYTGLMVWHGGLSGSSPLSMTTAKSAANAIPAGIIERIDPAMSIAEATSLIGLERTIGSAMNVFITGGLLVIIPVFFYILAPRRVDGAGAGVGVGPPPLSSPRPDEALPSAADDERGGAVPDWLERSFLIPWTLAAALLAGLAVYIKGRGAGSIGLNEINMAVLALGLVMHGSIRSYLAAAEEGARGCAGIIIQFPLYAGIMVMMRESGLVRMLSDAMLAAGDATTIPLLSFLSAAVVNIFVPSGGGQWAIQGPIALEAGLNAGIDPAKMIMSVAYGDQLTNMLQPFWALPLLAITGVKARDIVGYTALAMVVGGAWICLGLLIF